ncbi:IS1182 family transposase [Thermococcus sp.]|uniref:IS1182 family transposase n=1 Tax=Thermococcus sp. TaxID=35749 RepID=UPI0026120D6E|nr:IS1182 family transposase [Thermococcus sp.]
MSTNFIPVDRNTIYLLPPSVQDWLPEDHLARFVVDIVSQLNLRSITEQYGGRGSKAYHPRMLLALLFYGYATGVFSSRKLEKATYDSVAFRFIAANHHPDHDTIAAFRKRFLDDLKPLFVQILIIAKEMGLLKLGKVSLDGTKVKANASKHRALSWGHACKIEKQLQAEVAELMRLAEEADSADIPDEMNIPEELSRRQDRLNAIAEAKKKIEQRADERYSREVEEYERKVDARKTKAKETGKKPRGKDPKPPTAGPRDKDQVNLTDEESRIMPSAEGFKQAYNAQAAVDLDTMCVISTHVTQSPNDKQEVYPTLKNLDELPEQLGKVDTMLADTGYFSEANVNQCIQAEVTPLFSTGRQKHNQPLQERFTEPESLPDDADHVETMKHHLKTPEGKRLYAKRKSTVEPVFGIIKQVMGFRQFLLRGYEAVSGEWTLVSIAWNLKRMYALNG